MQNVILSDYRCEHCKKLFFKGIVSNATIEIKCKSCKNINTIKGENCLLLELSETNNNLSAICNRCENPEKCSRHKIIHEQGQCPVCHGNLK